MGGGRCHKFCFSQLTPDINGYIIVTSAYIRLALTLACRLRNTVYMSVFEVTFFIESCVVTANVSVAYFAVL
jgi:hypothetical protein